MSSEEIYKDENDIIKQLEEEQIIKGILEYTKNGTFPNESPNAYLNACSKIEKIGSADQYASKVLFEYYKKTIQKYLDDCYKIISKETTSQLIDSFIKQTEKINFLLYWMNRIFCYLDQHYLPEKNNTLSKSAINLYKDYFFNLLENDIYLEVNKLIREDRKCNLDSRPKIKTILRIISDLDLSDPKIVKNNDIISWIQEEGKDEKNETKYQDKWFDIFFKYETIRFAKDKGHADICNMSAIEYIKAQLKYFDEESIRQNEYINQKYHSKINEINYKYLIEEKAKELAEIDTGIPYMFAAKKNEELKKTFQLFKLNEGSLKVIFNEFERYINQRGREIIDDEENVKFPNRFFSKMIDLKKEMDDLVSECFENHDLFRNYGLNGELYAISLSNYIDINMRNVFRVKSEEEINNILNEIIDLYKIIKSKLIFYIYIKQRMNDRLVKGLSSSINAEKVFISMLVKEQGPDTFLCEMMQMIKDFEKNQKYIDSYKQSASKGNPNGIIFNVRIYRDMYWDIDKNYSQKMALPKYLSSCIEDFETFFFKNHSKDKLIWCLGLSRIQIQMLYLKNKNICTSTLPQLLILLQLEKNESLTIEQISELIGMNVSTVLPQVHALVFNPSFNPKHQPERGIILGTFNTNTQKFKVNDNIKINLNIIIEKEKFTTLLLPNKKTYSEDKELEDMDAIHKISRDNFIQAALTRILKSRIGQDTTLDWLINEVNKQIYLFKPLPFQIKENIKYLISKNVIERTKGKGNIVCYKYIP